MAKKISKKIILWTAPRCLSNAFLCSISTLKGTKHFHELFCGPHYFGSNGRYNPLNCNEELSRDELTFDGVKKILVADYPDVDLVFSKELTFCLPDSMYPEMINGQFADFTHTFLIRDPERAIYSYYNAISSDSQTVLDPSEIELFYYKIYKLYNFIKEKKGISPVVVDAVDLQTQPDKTMKSYCEAVGIQFDPMMTTWKPGGNFTPRYRAWPSKFWHSTVLQSTGFIKNNPEVLKPVPLNELPSEIQKYIEDSRFYYEELQRVRLKPVS